MFTTKLSSKLSRLFLRKPIYGESFLDEPELKILTSLVERCFNLEGNLIECGVYRGGSLIAIGNTLKRLNSNKILYGIDTFEGHPYTDEGTIHVKGLHSDANFEKVKKVIDKAGLDKIKIFKGKFLDVFPQLKDEKFCFANIDVNLYLSHKQCLEFLLPRMTKGGIIHLDDYNSKTSLKANKAVEEFIDKKDIVAIPNKGAYYIKK